MCARPAPCFSGVLNQAVQVPFSNMGEARWGFSERRICLLDMKPHDRMIGKFWASRENETADKFLSPGHGFKLATFNNHVFMQMLAKIAHSFAVAEGGFHSFRPLLRDLIVGSSQTASYWVGGNGDPKPADTGGLHRLELKRELRLGTEYVVCYVRLFANFGAPEYRVVVGTWSEGR